ncbi:MAG: hypothetical protein P8169_06680 [Chloroflexota bacterium]
MFRKRPIGITLLAILSVLSALLAFLHALQMSGIPPFNFGDLAFFGAQTSWIGALLWALLGLIYLWVTRMLWIVDPRGWIMLVLITFIGLIMGALSIIGRSGWHSLLPTIVINSLILIYCFLPSTKEAFFVKQ